MNALVKTLNVPLDPVRTTGLIAFGLAWAMVVGLLAAALDVAAPIHAAALVAGPAVAMLVAARRLGVDRPPAGGRAAGGVAAGGSPGSRRMQVTSSHWARECRESDASALAMERRRASSGAAERRPRSHHDPLTGLPDGELLLETLGKAREPVSHSPGHGPTPAAGALLLLDVDHFRHVNQALGWTAGDAVLRLVAERLWLGLPRGAGLFRMAGDTFAVVLDDIGTLEDAALLAVGLLEILREPEPLPGRVEGRPVQLSVSACIGVVEYTRGMTDPKDALRDANAALSHARMVKPGSVRSRPATPDVRPAAGRNLTHHPFDSCMAAACARPARA